MADNETSKFSARETEFMVTVFQCLKKGPPTVAQVDLPKLAARTTMDEGGASFTWDLIKRKLVEEAAKGGVPQKIPHKKAKTPARMKTLTSETSGTKRKSTSGEKDDDDEDMANGDKDNDASPLATTVVDTQRLPSHRTNHDKAQRDTGRALATRVASEGEGAEILAGSLDILFDAQKNWYSLKRKNSDGEVMVASKRLRPSGGISVLFDDPSLNFKLHTKNVMLLEEIALLNKQLEHPPIKQYIEDAERWYQALMDAKQKTRDKRQKEHRMRDELLAILTEHKENENLWKESEGLSQSRHLNLASISMSPGHLHTNALALGVVQIRTMLEGKRAEMFSRAAKLEQDMKDMGCSLI